MPFSPVFNSFIPVIRCTQYKEIDKMGMRPHLILTRFWHFKNKVCSLPEETLTPNRTIHRLH